MPASSRMSIEETKSLADQFWATSPYIQHLHPDRAAFLARVLEQYARERRKPMGRETALSAPKIKTA